MNDGPLQECPPGRSALDEDTDALGDGSHLVEVVADVDCGCSGFSLDSSQLQEDAVACLVVQGADWLVEQEEFWLGCHGSCERHALTLAPESPSIRRASRCSIPSMAVTSLTVLRRSEG